LLIERRRRNFHGAKSGVTLNLAAGTQFGSPSAGQAAENMNESRPPAFFIADAVGLDFLNTIATPVDQQVEWIASGADLLAWLGAAALLRPDIRETFERSAVPGELDAVAAQARALREWFRAFVHEHKGKPLRRQALNQLEPLNQVLARDEEFGQIVARDQGDAQAANSALTWRSQRRWRSPDALLLPIARSMADLICGEDFTHVKACGGPTCSLLFMDRTRSHARRWCSMAVCGNRVKQAAHRERVQRDKP
jgi:predicted RNA-binding Zn ribbon-like protein